MGEKKFSKTALFVLWKPFGRDRLVIDKYGTIKKFVRRDQLVVGKTTNLGILYQLLEIKPPAEVPTQIARLHK